ncbi:MAG: GNAT family N-acetyltransferase [Gammaproteobacteria bacterium]|nr:GNAT family N-acetyltransferase [Gammaproteobacteria bacterium]
MHDYHVETIKLKSIEDIKEDWLNLQERANCSYFQSWGWIGTWLKIVANDLTPILIKIISDDVTVGMGVFVSKNIKRHQVIKSEAVYLNECPFNGRNMVIEYNGLLLAKGHEQEACAKTIQSLYDNFEKNEEFVFSAITEEGYQQLRKNNNDNYGKLKLLERSMTWSVDLGKINSKVDGYLSCLSKNRRAQIRRSIKVYEEKSALVLVEAKNKDEALLYFDRLKELHTERWKIRKKKGSFANPIWENFHRTLIESRFEEGEIQLIKVGNKEGAIGYLYNFIWRKHVYVLQTGFKMSDDKCLMPGYVTHVYAIAHNKEKGMDIYDLMHGDALYKRILCNKIEVLYWAALQRKRLKFFLEDLARTTIRKARGI